MCAGHCTAKSYILASDRITYGGIGGQEQLQQHHIIISALNNLDCVIDKYQTVVFLTTCNSPTDAISDCLNVDSLVRAGVLSLCLSSWLLQLRTVGELGDSLKFSVWAL